MQMHAKTPADSFRSACGRTGPLLFGALLGAACLAPSTAAAVPFAQRLSLRGEAMLSHVAGEPNTRYFGFGFFGSARVGVALAGPFSLQAAASVGVFPAAGNMPLGTSVTATYTGGVRFEPRTVRPEGRLFIEGNAGVAATGADFYRFAFDVGVGWELQVTRYLYLGPVFRYWHIYQPDSFSRTADGQADAHYFSLGLSMHIRPSPPPRTRAGTLLAINAADAPDGDHDGVPDLVDDCPDVVEDHDGWRDEDGCPDLDDDEDNFPDSEDRCPRQSETPNGFEDEDGCPDALPDTAETVTRAEGHIRTRQRVYFPVSRAQIQPYVMGSLRAVARYLIDHPEVRRVRVEGHADDRGTRRAGFELSLRRALAVVNFLTEQGVARARLDPVGLGDLAPLEPPHDEVTRARNRRIEFAIEGEAPPPPTGAWTLAAHPLSDLPGAR
jgi:outer membrane protein OmpA-like peptidoglycan-associated protein